MSAAQRRLLEALAHPGAYALRSDNSTVVHLCTPGLSGDCSRHTLDACLRRGWVRLDGAIYGMGAVVMTEAGRRALASAGEESLGQPAAVNC